MNAAVKRKVEAPMPHPNDAPRLGAFAPQCAFVGLPEDLRHDLIRAREARGWSQQHLADLAGTTRSTVYRTEHGLTVPRADNLAAFLKQLSLPIDAVRSISAVSSPDTGEADTALPGGASLLPESALVRLLHYCLSLTEDEAVRALAALRRLLREDADSR